MKDIDREFRRWMGTSTVSAKPAESAVTADELFTAMRCIQKELGPPPPQVRASKYVPAMGGARPTKEPLTDDMRTMVGDIGQQRVPVAWHVDTQFGKVVFLNPVNWNSTKTKRDS